jgi:hypothetical protein
LNRPADVPVDAARMRPRFSVELPVSAEEAVRRLRDGLDTPELRNCTRTAGSCADFHVDDEVRRIWSPRLAVRIEEAPGGSVLHGRFSPRPDVWTGFMFVYFLVAFLIVFGATFGWVQQASGEPAWGYWAVPVGLLVIVGIHLLSYLGQRRAADQMRELRGRLDSVLDGQFGAR